MNIQSIYDIVDSPFRLPRLALNTQDTSAKSADELKTKLFDDENETFDNWTDTYRTNVAQIFFMSTAFLPLLQKSTETRYGYSATIINISSISGIVKTSQHQYETSSSLRYAVTYKTDGK